MPDEVIPSAPAAKPKPEKAAKCPVSALANEAFPPVPKRSKSGKVIGKMPPFDFWQHNAAAALHCWAQHKHHLGKEIELTQADYDKALAAAQKLDAKGVPHPHKPALYDVPTGA